MKLGIVGLPNVGKSTLFNAITKAGAESANYPFCTIDPNIGIVSVPDERLDQLSKLYNPRKITPTAIEFVDIAGLVRGASRGEGLGNKFLAHIREVDAIRDIETIHLELIFSDLEAIEKRMDRTRKSMKGGDRRPAAELELQERIKSVLEAGRLVRTMKLTEEEQEWVDGMFLLTSKPLLYCANVSEADLATLDTNAQVARVKEAAAQEHAEVMVICARIEEEIAQLDDADRQAFLEELGLKESGLDQLVKASYKLLGLISFLTAGEQEVRAWTIVRGTKAPQAAGKIHTDFERGFIRAEIVAYDDLIRLGSYASAREQGLVRSEGKEYVMKDGDVTLFRFNV